MLVSTTLDTGSRAGNLFLSAALKQGKKTGGAMISML